MTERTPYGILDLGAAHGDTRYHWVDAEGVILQEARTRPAGLPVVQGMDVATSDATDRPTRLRSEAQTRVLRAFYRLKGRTLARFDVLRHRGYDVVLQARSGWRALLPTTDLRAQIERLRRVRRALRERGMPRWRVLDLRNRGEVTVRK